MLKTARVFGALVDPRIANRLDRPRLLLHLQEQVAHTAKAAPDESAPALACRSR